MSARWLELLAEAVARRAHDSGVERLDRAEAEAQCAGHGGPCLEGRYPLGNGGFRRFAAPAP